MGLNYNIEEDGRQKMTFNAITSGVCLKVWQRFRQSFYPLVQKVFSLWRHQVRENCIIACSCDRTEISQDINFKLLYSSLYFCNYSIPCLVQAHREV